MTCDERQAEISALLDGALPDDAAGGLFGHMSTCPRCRRFHAASTAVRDAVLREEPGAFPQELDRRLAERLRRMPAAPGARRETFIERLRQVLAAGIRVPATAAAAVLLLAALLGGFAARTVLAPPSQERRTVVVFPTVVVAAFVKADAGM
jgi:anti-sigma factor RsiW